MVHHPERTGTLVVLLDGFVEVGVPPGSLDRAARIVWAIARHHLSVGDRVGLLSTGAAPVWLPPAAGRRARWQVLDALLAVGATVAGSSPARPDARRRRWEAAATVPADAVVVGVSSLQSDAFVAGAVHHRRLGRPTVVVGIELADLLAPPTDEVERAARRLWAVETEARRAKLSGAGVPSMLVADDPASVLGWLGVRCRRPAGRTREPSSRRVA